MGWVKGCSRSEESRWWEDESTPLSPESRIHPLLASSSAYCSSPFGSLSSPSNQFPASHSCGGCAKSPLLFSFSQTQLQLSPWCPFVLSAGSRAPGITVAKATGFGGCD